MSGRKWLTLADLFFVLSSVSLKKNSFALMVSKEKSKAIDYTIFGLPRFHLVVNPAVCFLQSISK